MCLLQGESLFCICTQVSTIPVRRETIRKKARCFVYLLRSHHAKDCQSHRKCWKYGRKHYQSLCEQGSTFQPSENTDSKETPMPTRVGQYFNISIS